MKILRFIAFILVFSSSVPVLASLAAETPPVDIKYYPVDFVYYPDKDDITLNKKHIDPSKCTEEMKHYSGSTNLFCCELPGSSKNLAESMKIIKLETSNTFYHCNKEGHWNNDVITTKYSDKSIDFSTITKTQGRLDYRSSKTKEGRFITDTRCHSKSTDTKGYGMEVVITPGKFSCKYYDEKLCSLIIENEEDLSDTKKTKVKEYISSKDFKKEEKANYEKSYMESLYSLIDRNKYIDLKGTFQTNSLFTDKYSKTMEELLEESLNENSYKSNFIGGCKKMLSENKKPEEVAKKTVENKSIGL